jgi:hypothetical protein
MFLRIIASKKVYFAQLLSQKTFYEFVKGKFSIIFISAGVKLPALKGRACGEQSGQLFNEDIKTRIWNISVLNS